MQSRRIDSLIVSLYTDGLSWASAFQGVSQVGLPQSLLFCSVPTHLTTSTTVTRIGGQSKTVKKIQSLSHFNYNSLFMTQSKKTYCNNL